MLPHAHSHPEGHRGPVLAGHPLPNPQPSPTVKALTSPLPASASSHPDNRTIQSLDCCDHTWLALSGELAQLSRLKYCVLGSRRGSRTSLALSPGVIPGRIVQRLNIALCSVVSQNRMEEGGGQPGRGVGVGGMPGEGRSLGADREIQRQGNNACLSARGKVGRPPVPALKAHRIPQSWEGQGLS